eukprot:m.180352 g.180352  ORF g.180352 m.180352 type:complete len:53 (+) comp21463_c0_seq3:864-1022(+)
MHGLEEYQLFFIFSHLTFSPSDSNTSTSHLIIFFAFFFFVCFLCIVLGFACR